MKAKLIILGCGSSVGVPRIDDFWGSCNKNNKRNYRTRCSAIIAKGSNYILIDASPDLRKQLLLNKVKNISSVVITHEHADQTNGLFELRPFYWKYRKKINVYGNAKTLHHLKKIYYYLYNKVGDYPAIVKFNLVKPKFSLGKFKEKVDFTTINVKHGKTSSVVYIFEKSAYISDCNDLSIVNIEELKNLKYLVLDCLKFKKHPTHFNLKDALFIHDHLKPRKTILTNLHYDIDYDYLLKIIPNNVIPAYDGLSLNL